MGYFCAKTKQNLNLTKYRYKFNVKSGYLQITECMLAFSVYFFQLLSTSSPGVPFCHALEIGTPGQVQRHSGFEWLCKHIRLRPEPIRFVRLDSGHAQSDGKSVNHGLPVLYLARGRDPRLLNKRIAGSGNEIELLLNEFNEKHNIRQLNSVFPTESG